MTCLRDLSKHVRPYPSVCPEELCEVRSYPLGGENAYNDEDPHSSAFCVKQTLRRMMVNAAFNIGPNEMFGKHDVRKAKDE